MKFRAVIQLNGKTATGIEVPAEIVEALGAGKKPPVHVTIGPYTYRSTVAFMRGRFLIPVSAENRKGADVSAGDEVEVELKLDTEPRIVEVPADFGEALEQEADAQRTFENLSYSNKRRFVLSIEDAKTPETRRRRIVKAVEQLKAGQSR